jgi:HEAT repeat protein
MLYRNKFAIISMLVILTAASVVADAAQTTKQKFDSLFVIASSLDIKYKDQVGPAREAIAAMAPDVVALLIDKLGTVHARERVTLEEIFKKIGKPAVPYLNKALLNTDSLRLSRIALMLYYLPDSSSVDNLLKVTGNGYYWVRYQALRALGKIGDHKAVDAVRRALKDKNELVRTMAAWAGGQLINKDLVYDLIKALDDPYYGVRMASHDALKAADCGLKKQYILSSLTAPSPRIRKYLLSVIVQDSCPYDMSTVKLYMSDDDPVTRSLALWAAERLDPEFVSDYLKQLPDSTVDFLVRQTIEDLTEQDETKAPAHP